jgi:ribokinase
MRVLTFGSINIDIVFAVPHFVRPGETIAANGVKQFAGGKGANQSVALARAGATVFHAGRVGTDGAWVVDQLRPFGVDTSLIVIDAERRTGSAFIQVDPTGQNAIVLDGGANHAITHDQIESTLAQFGPGDVLLLQNELNDVPTLIRAAKQRGLTIAFNPAPMTDAVRDYPLDLIDTLIVNEIEAEALAGTSDPSAALRRLPGRHRYLTLGERGAIAFDGQAEFTAAAPRVDAVDTTAAGDTFIGFCLASRLREESVERSMALACRAAALCVSRPGAMQSIPALAEVQSAR